MSFNGDLRVKISRERERETLLTCVTSPFGGVDSDVKLLCRTWNDTLASSVFHHIVINLEKIVTGFNLNYHQMP